MAMMPAGHFQRALLALALVVATTFAASASDRRVAQQAAPADQGGADEGAGAAAPSLGKAPAPFKPEAEPAAPDVWIFTGALRTTHESFSGTLVAGKDQSQFELKLSGGATCDGDSLAGEVGLVRLSEITCSDDRTMRALFVPQGGKELKVFGHIGDERFMTSAHLLGTEAVPDKPQTSAPAGPLGLSPSPAPGDGAPAAKPN